MSWSPNRIYHFVVCSRARSRSDSHGQGAPRGPAADGGDGMRVPTFAPSAASSNENLKVWSCGTWSSAGSCLATSRRRRASSAASCRPTRASPSTRGSRSPRPRPKSAPEALLKPAPTKPAATPAQPLSPAVARARGRRGGAAPAGEGHHEGRQGAASQAAGEEGGRAVEDRGDHAARFLIFPTETRLIRSHGFAWACAYSVAIVAYCVLFFILFLCLFTLLNFM